MVVLGYVPGFKPTLLQPARARPVLACCFGNVYNQPTNISMYCMHACVRGYGRRQAD